MTFKFNHELRGGHVHVAVFSGKDRDHLGKCGDLVMREEEWTDFESLLTCGMNWQEERRATPADCDVAIFEDMTYPNDPGGNKILVYPNDPIEGRAR